MLAHTCGAGMFGDGGAVSRRPHTPWRLGLFRSFICILDYSTFLPHRPHWRGPEIRKRNFLQGRYCSPEPLSLWRPMATHRCRESKRWSWLALFTFWWRKEKKKLQSKLWFLCFSLMPSFFIWSRDKAPISWGSMTIRAWPGMLIIRFLCFFRAV